MNGASFDVHVAADHPAFDGHFAGAPVLPGVVLLSLVMEAVRSRPAWSALLGSTAQIEQVKWLAPVGPDQRLRIDVSARAGGLDFEIRREATAIARGRLSCPA